MIKGILLWIVIIIAVAGFTALVNKGEQPVNRDDTWNGESA